MTDWFECKVPQKMYSALAEVTPPLGYREVSRIFEDGWLVKVFFEPIDAVELAIFTAP